MIYGEGIGDTGGVGLAGMAIPINQGAALAIYVRVTLCERKPVRGVGSSRVRVRCRTCRRIRTASLQHPWFIGLRRAPTCIQTRLSVVVQIRNAHIECRKTGSHMDESKTHMLRQSLVPREDTYQRCIRGQAWRPSFCRSDILSDIEPIQSVGGDLPGIASMDDRCVGWQCQSPVE